MHTITYGAAVSDGFLAGVDGSIDWLHYSQDVRQVMTDYWKNVDSILMGRKTYAFAAANTPKKTEPPRARPRARAPMSSPARILILGLVFYYRRLILDSGYGRPLSPPSYRSTLD